MSKHKRRSSDSGTGAASTPMPIPGDDLGTGHLTITIRTDDSLFLRRIIPIGAVIDDE